jgi:hypothetical protein
LAWRERPHRWRQGNELQERDGEDETQQDQRRAVRLILTAQETPDGQRGEGQGRQLEGGEGGGVLPARPAGDTGEDDEGEAREGEGGGGRNLCHSLTFVRASG